MCSINDMALPGNGFLLWGVIIIMWKVDEEDQIKHADGEYYADMVSVIIWFITYIH